MSETTPNRKQQEKAIEKVETKLKNQLDKVDVLVETAKKALDKVVEQARTIHDTFDELNTLRKHLEAPLLPGIDTEPVAGQNDGGEGEKPEKSAKKPKKAKVVVPDGPEEASS